jgi:hypothetical protein
MLFQGKNLLAPRLRGRIPEMWMKRRSYWTLCRSSTKCKTGSIGYHALDAQGSFWGTGRPITLWSAGWQITLDGQGSVVDHSVDGRVQLWSSE